MALSGSYLYGVCGAGSAEKSQETFAGHLKEYTEQFAGAGRECAH